MPLEDLTDDQLLAKLDNHPEQLDSVGSSMLEDMLKQRQKNTPRPLSQRQRAWAVRMIEQLDRRGD